jgi:hypothetical protein
MIIIQGPAKEIIANKLEDRMMIRELKVVIPKGKELRLSWNLMEEKLLEWEEGMLGVEDGLIEVEDWLVEV